MKKGDMVQLKSGGCKMTVKVIIGNNELTPIEEQALKNQGFPIGYVCCTWIVGKSLQTAVFDPVLLK